MPILVLKSINRCNAGCIYCFSDKTGQLKKPGSSFITNLFIKIRQYLEAQSDQNIEIQWHGGEPLLLGKKFYGRLNTIQSEICAGLSGRISHSFQSNLTLLTREYLEVIQQLNLKNIGTSVDPDITMRKLKGKGESGLYLHKLLRSICLLEEKRIEYGMNYVVTANSFKDPEEIFYYLTNINLKGTISVNPVFIKNAGLHKLVVTPAEFAGFLTMTYPYWWKNRNRFNSIEPYRTITSSAEYILGNSKPDKKLNDIPVIIDMEGFYYHFKKPAYKLGNFFNDSIDEMVQKTKNSHEKLIRKLSDVRLCHNCNLWPFCYANTNMDAFSQNDELSDNSWCLARQSFIREYIIPFLNKNNEAA